MSARRFAAMVGARLALVALLAVAGSSCGSESITAPSGSTLRLTTPAKSVSVNGTAVLTAELIGNSGQPMAGASVAFNTTLGVIEPPQVVTNAAGQATVVFSAGTASGTAAISASSGTIHANPMTLVVGIAAVGRVAVTASPASVPFGGGTSTVTAVVTDAAGNPLRSMPVGFTTTAGTLTPANAKTDTNGFVQTTLTTPAAAVVTAVAGATPVDTPGTPAPTITGSVTIGLAARPVPVVSIAASANPVAGSPVTFTIGAMPAPGTNTTMQNVSVNFGDGDRTSLGAVSGAAIVVQHVYEEGGTYTVTMTATDSGGGMATASTVLAVQASAPMSVSIAAGPMVPAGGGPKAIVAFTATVFPATSVVTSYLWDFGDGSAAQRTTANQVQHVFETAGLYTVTVTATEALTERTAVGSVPISTASGMPTVSVMASANPVAGRAMTFTIAAMVAPGSSVTMQNVRVAFGDGAGAVDLGGVTGSAITAGHIYASPGTYLATVTATDSASGTATASARVVVAAAAAPSVSVTVGANPLAGTPTTITINASPAPGGGTTIQNVQVTYGDGTAPVDLGAVNGPATTQHVYATGGNYTVSATVTDSGGVTATASTQAVVAAPGAPTVSVTASAGPVAGTATTFTIASAPAPGSSTTVQNVRVTFGDGTPPVDLGAVSNPATTQHVYAASGSYTVSVTATASNAATATASIQVVVAAPGAPTVSVTASASPVVGIVTTFTISAAPAPGSNATIQNVRVTFGDGAAPVDLGAVSGSTTTQHIYTASGSYTVSAVATASNGATATAATQVAVAAPGAPSVSVTVSARPVAATATTFTITATPAPGSNTTIQNVRVTFGDGTAAVDLGAVSGATTTQHVFAVGGSYTVSVTATATNGVTAAIATQVVVAAPPSPSVSIAASANPITGRAMTFTITTAPAPGSNTTIQNVQVSFGDFTAPANLGAVSGTATTQHVYAAAGTFAVSATATDTGGGTATSNTSVVVVAAANASLGVSANPMINTPVQFTATVNPAAGVTVQSVTLQYGDNTQDNLGAISGTPAVRSHTYATSGVKAVTLTVALVGFSSPLTSLTNVTVAPCPALSTTHTVTSNLSGLLYAWPGGDTDLGTAACSVTVRAPTGLISNLGGDTWSIVKAFGFSASNCTLTAQVPICRGPGSSSDLRSGRPYCSNSALGGGASTASVLVSCR